MYLVSKQTYQDVINLLAGASATVELPGA